MQLHPGSASSCFAFLAVVAATPAAAARRDSLVVRGHVVDSLGAAIRESWVITQGSRRLGTLVEPSGAYTLVIPGASTEELQRAPLKLRVQARHKGWSIVLANGAPELALEIRLVRDAEGVTRLEVESNDPAAAAAVANTAVLEAGLRAEVIAEFKGAKGEQVTGDARLSAIEAVRLAGARDSVRYDQMRPRDPPPGSPSRPGRAGVEGLRRQRRRDEEARSALKLPSLIAKADATARVVAVAVVAAAPPKIEPPTPPATRSEAPVVAPPAMKAEPRVASDSARDHREVRRDVVADVVEREPIDTVDPRSDRAGRSRPTGDHGDLEAGSIVADDRGSRRRPPEGGGERHDCSTHRRPRLPRERHRSSRSRRPPRWRPR